MWHVHNADSGRAFVTHSSSSDITEKGVASGSKYTVAAFSSGDNWYGATATPGSSISNTGGSSISDTGAASSNASEAHTNMQPYIVVNRWHRTA
jgi:microcystin-dependent protein